ncbi:4-coumarate-CoA ligase [Lineolata rhizophorae]|uniref:4-coumarate-CoA ligase n=1 Tax=Lineolata rhizophorae TaxID=578093 RepID=A0A6A6PA52_9PEZI|nr:4-coumarate-CoA ligase [Lineolata rhizophorae]
MVFQQEKSIDLPNVDLLTLLFDHELCDAKELSVIHAEAADPSYSITKAQARKLTKQVAHSLRTHFGIGANGAGKDVVVTISSGQYLLPTAFYGIVAAGGVFSAASGSFTAAELARQIKDGDSNVVICCQYTKDVAIAAAKECGLGLDRVLVLRSYPKMSLRSVEGDLEMFGQGELDWERITDPQELKDRLICLLYSSGTTGIPKGVLISNQNLVAETVLPHALWREANAKLEAEGQSPFESRTLGHLPTAHIAGLQTSFINAFYEGGTVFWVPKFSFPEFLKYHKQYRLTIIVTVPPIYLLIAKMPDVTDQFDSVRLAISGAAPLSKELQYAASMRLGKGKTFISQAWGLSETTGSVTLLAHDKKDLTGSVSPLMPNMQMKVVDDDDNEVEEGERGEIVVKGPLICNGYHNNEKATKEVLRDGWLYTGDIGMLRDGLIYVVDRKKELIKYKGLQVAPAELEGLLLSHELIKDAAVIGIDTEETEVPRAYVVADKEKVSEEDIKAFVKNNAASHKQLRGGVVYIPAVPKSASGKILRKDLREMARREGNSKL